MVYRLEGKALLDIGVFMDLCPGFLMYQCIGTRTLKLCSYRFFNAIIFE